MALNWRILPFPTSLIIAYKLKSCSKFDELLDAEISNIIPNALPSRSFNFFFGTYSICKLSTQLFLLNTCMTSRPREIGENGYAIFFSGEGEDLKERRHIMVF